MVSSPRTTIRERSFIFPESPSMYLVLVSYDCVSANVQSNPDDLGAQVGVPVGLSLPALPPGTCGMLDPTQAKFPLEI